LRVHPGRERKICAFRFHTRRGEVGSTPSQAPKSCPKSEAAAARDGIVIAASSKRRNIRRSSCGDRSVARLPPELERAPALALAIDKAFALLRGVVKRCTMLLLPPPRVLLLALVLLLPVVPPLLPST